MRFSLALALLFFCTTTPAIAGPNLPQVDAIGVHLGSWHSEPTACAERWNDTRRCNNSNPGVYLRSGAWAAGGYYNSIRRPTAYIARNWIVGYRGPFSIEIAAGVATGYRAAPLVPLLMPAAAVKITDRVTARLSYLPEFGKWNKTHVAHFSVEVRR